MGTYGHSYMSLVKFGVSDYAAPKHLKIAPPARPQLTLEPDVPMLEGPEPEPEGEVLRLM